MNMHLPEATRHLPVQLIGAGHKMFLAGIGTMGVVSHMTTTLFDTLVDEGRRVEKNGLKALDRMVNLTTDTVTDAVQDTVTLVQDNVQQVTKKALNRLGMPARRDVADLKVRVEHLTHKLDLIGPVKTRGRKGARHAR